MCICRDNLSWKKLKHSGAEKMNWGWEWRLLKSKSFFCLPFMFIKGGLHSLPVITCWQRMLLCLYDDRTCQIHEEKVKTTDELLRRRELALKTMEATYDQRLKNELSRYFHHEQGLICNVYISQTRVGESWNNGKTNQDEFGEFYFAYVESERSMMSCKVNYCICPWSLVALARAFNGWNKHLDPKMWGK